MELEKLTKGIISLHSQYQALLPLPSDIETRLWKKFRLEWNYNSNHIEGNTLTYGETELLLYFDKLPEKTDNKDYRDLEEMKGHDVALSMIRQYSQDPERPLSETFIRQLNEIILVRPFYKKATTPSGEPSEKLIQPGQYKTSPNSVRTASGEIFQYATPEETASKMTDLIKWYRAAESEKSNTVLHIASKLHYDFVRIHPFDDGNGRLARLLMNYVFLRHGYPPAIIKSADKDAYLTALNRADTGNFSAFESYIGKQLEWSLTLALKAASGEPVDEPDDVDKEIAILAKRTANATLVQKSREVVKETFNKKIRPFAEQLISELSKFNDLFTSTEISLSINNSRNYQSLEEIFHALKDISEAIPTEEFKNPLTEVDYIAISLYWSGYKNDGVKTFNQGKMIRISFEKYKYIISTGDSEEFNLSYDQPITESKAHDFILTLKKSILQSIKKQLGEDN